MANLLNRWGIKPDLEKAYSISFIDSFADCSYKVYLSKFLGIRESKVEINRTFGSACHEGMKAINMALKGNSEPCKECAKECKLNTPKREDAILLPPTECPTQQLMNEAFLATFNSEVQNTIIEHYADQNKREEGLEEIKDLLRIGPNILKDVAFKRQPSGVILAAETRLEGMLDSYKLVGVVDLMMAVTNKAGEARSIVFDYKSRGTKPEGSSFPVRQFALYVKMLEDKKLPVDGLGTIYMIKNDPPKKPRKGSAPFQQSIAHYINLRTNRALYEHVLKLLKEDMEQITDAIQNGIFIRNRGSMFCGTCEVKKYCENDKAVECHMNNKRRPKA